MKQLRISFLHLAPVTSDIGHNRKLVERGVAAAAEQGREQRRRFLADLEQRRAQGLPLVPLDEAFLGALAEGMPPSAGMALGVERLVMLLTGAGRIGEVIPFGWEER